MAVAFMLLDMKDGDRSAVEAASMSRNVSLDACQRAYDDHARLVGSMSSTAAASLKRLTAVQTQHLILAFKEDISFRHSHDMALFDRLRMEILVQNCEEPGAEQWSYDKRL
ncbi:Uu.00g134040.m01.CDS01 [Anthostomella pinea]|uniref:Uu.00g134040.m01.CDS01 n=1 Tax=Anthostomella pinea TaxID=933095 RepID=A0AAI8VIF1_9PEZI|nr:Uu.00g134040.m01.CDS01 [Anthostomella pinea]